MPTGGGTWEKQDKISPGVYINVIASQSYIFESSERGYVAMPLFLDWGIEGQIFTVTADDFRKKSTEIFGYSYTHEKMKGLRDLFKHAKVLYAYRAGSGQTAQNEYATAKYPGARGNDLKINVIEKDSGLVVQTLLTTNEINRVVDSQIIPSNATTEALIDNDFVDWQDSVTLNLGTFPLSGGQSVSDMSDEDCDYFLEQAYHYTFNVLSPGISNTATQRQKFVDFTKEMRNNKGRKFQLVMFAPASMDADDEGVIVIYNGAIGGERASSIVYWVAGACAGVPLNESLTYKDYDGEFELDLGQTDEDLENATQSGFFCFHKVGGKVKVYKDINTLVTLSEDKNEDLKNNQVIRIIDQIATDITKLFVENYIGTMPNDTAGRIALWNAIVKYLTDLQISRAIDEFDSKNVTVKQGDKKVAVVAELSIKPVSAMEQLYMNIVVI